MSSFLEHIQDTCIQSLYNIGKARDAELERNSQEMKEKYSFKSIDDVISYLQKNGKVSYDVYGYFKWDKSNESSPILYHGPSFNYCSRYYSIKEFKEEYEDKKDNDGYLLFFKKCNLFS